LQLDIQGMKKKNVAVVIWETQHRHEQEPT